MGSLRLPTHPMSRVPKSVHLELDAEMTRCGQLTEGLETRVSSGTREYVLKTTTERSKVTCKRCIRSIKAEERNL